MRISCSMICWNEESTIDLALKSLTNFADEVVIVDTGSFDDTIKVAQETMDILNLSGQIKQTQVTNLGQARLESFLLCDGGWVLMQDSNLVLSDKLKWSMLKHTRSNSKLVGAIKSLNLMGDYDHFFGYKPFMGYHPVFVKKSEAKWEMGIDRPVFSGDQIQYNYWAVNLSRVRPAWRYWYRGEQFDPRYYSNPVELSIMMKLRLWGGLKWESLGLPSNILSALSGIATKISPATQLKKDIKEAQSKRTHRNISNMQYQWQKENKYNSPLQYVEATLGHTFEEVKMLAPDWYLNLLCGHARCLAPGYMLGLPAVIQEERKNPRYRLIRKEKKIVGRWPEL